MSKKKAVTLDGLVRADGPQPAPGIPQRGGAAGGSAGKRRLTLAVDSGTYRRLRMHAAESGQTHQAILGTALAEYLERANAQLMA